MTLPRYFELVVRCHTNRESSFANFDTIVDLDCCKVLRKAKLFYHEVFSQEDPLVKITVDKDIVSRYEGSDRRELVEAEILAITRNQDVGPMASINTSGGVRAKIPQNPPSSNSFHLS